MKNKENIIYFLKEKKTPIIISIIFILLLITCILFSILTKDALNNKIYEQFLLYFSKDENIKNVSEFLNYANNISSGDKTEYYKIIYGNLWQMKYSWNFLTYLGITIFSSCILIMLCYFLFDWMGNRNENR